MLTGTIQYLAYGLQTSDSITQAFIGFLIATVAVPMLVLAAAVCLRLTRKRRKGKVQANNDQLLVIVSVVIATFILSLIMMNGFAEGSVVIRILALLAGLVALATAIAHRIRQKRFTYGNIILICVGILAMIVAIAI
jgi:hypothetical protein